MDPFSIRHCDACHRPVVGEHSHAVPTEPRSKHVSNFAAALEDLCAALPVVQSGRAGVKLERARVLISYALEHVRTAARIERAVEGLGVGEEPPATPATNRIVSLGGSQ